MELTQQDFQERLARIADGTADDEDLRLVKHYRREGFTADPAAITDEGDEESESDGYDDLDYRALQGVARDRGVDASGKQSEIIARLRAADTAAREE